MDITQTMDPELKATFEHFPAFPVPQNANDFAAFRKLAEEAVAAYGGVKNDNVVIEDRIVPMLLER